MGGHRHLHSQNKSVNIQDIKLFPEQDDQWSNGLYEHTSQHYSFSTKFIWKRKENNDSSQVSSEVATTQQINHTFLGAFLSIGNSPVYKTSVSESVIIEITLTSLMVVTSLVRVSTLLQWTFIGYLIRLHKGESVSDPITSGICVVH